jgi:predicted permease
MNDVTERILSVLIPILLGWALRLGRIFGDREGDVLRSFVVRFALPVLVFFSMYDAGRDDISAMPSMLASLVVLTAALFPLGLLCSRLFKGTDRRTAVHACCTFGNYGWLGFGVAQVLLGEPGLRRAVFFCVLWWPVFYGFGLPIGLIHARRERGGLPIWKAVRLATPVISCLVVGFLFNLRGWRLPSLLETTMRPFGETTVPLILISVGMMLDLSGIRKALAPALLVSAFTLLVKPLIGWALAAVLTRDPTSYAVVILNAAMPVATLTPVLAENFEMDLDVTNTSIVLSTLLSLITLPIVAYLVVA